MVDQKNAGKMNTKDFIQYLTEQIEWHDMKANRYKYCNFYLKLSSVFLSVSISIFSIAATLWEIPISPLVTAIMAGGITLIEAVSNFFHFDKFQVLYREISLILTYELNRYKLNVSPYNQSAEENLTLLVDKADSVLIEISREWKRIRKSNIK